MKESCLESKICTMVKQRGGIALKWTSPGFTGVPDRIVILPRGRIFFVEVKRLGGKRTARQVRVGEILEGLGCQVFVIDNLSRFEEVLEIYGV